MTDSQSAAPAYTSGCGNVIIEAADTAPVVKLSAAAVRMPVRELADLIAFTARDAADAMRTDTANQEAGLGSAADALAELKNLRDGIRSEGLEAVIQRKGGEFGAEDALPADDPRAMSRLALNPGAVSTANLDAAIAMLERFQTTPGGAPTPLEGDADAMVGVATSEDGQVTVEATGTYPIARLLLGLHAREMGPDLLAQQITATAERAVANRDERQRAHIDAAGLPLTMEQVEGLPGQIGDYARKVAGQAAFLQQDYQQQIRRFK
ncbi:hypothetical protein [Glycomyces terrestris]|uniref:Uncharacterized protein n=1 Tax=Glycomyces terrestris TaxID=2493553 RepID=A0A426V3I1_9ACTN|nr:hypothetical protein [Glycomyces terrestris]RRS01416.1 hypothetical protein EIW28_01175 [Glycomyces terrestris]